MATVLSLEDLPEKQAEMYLLMRGVVAGEPRGWIEAYLKVASEAGPLVPLLFSNEPNQEYYYGELREQMDGWRVDVVTEKDRKARWTTFVAAVVWAKMVCIPGTRVLWVADSEDTTAVGSRIMETFYANMPEHARPDKGKVWGAEQKELVFASEEGEQKSWIIFRTASNPNLGTAETPTDVVFDEYPKFPKTYGAAAQASVRAAMTGMTSFWRGGSVGPDGADCMMYQEVQAIKKGLSQTKLLFRPWFANPANHLPPGHRHRRPADMRDEDIVAGDASGGLDADKEPMLMEMFPKDDVPVVWRLARRRAWLKDALAIAGGEGNEDAARVYFAREHPEDDVTMWLTAGRMMFDMKMMDVQRAIATAKENFVVASEVLHGLKFVSYRKYDPAHVYIGGMDLGSGSRGDDTSMQLFDATSMTFVGELHGNVTEPHQAVQVAVEVLRRYGNAVLVLETNRFPGIGNYVRRTLGYEPVFKPPKRDNETAERWVQRPYGIQVGSTHHSDKEPSTESLLAMFKADFNSGAFRVVNPLLLGTMQMWDDARDKHCPDRIAAARLVRLGLPMARARAPLQRFGVQDGTPRLYKTQKHGRIQQDGRPSGIAGVPSRFH